MIGIFSLSDAQKKLLEQRNIVLLDFSVCCGVNGSHEKALNLFFDFLFFKKKIGNNLEWPEEKQLVRQSTEEDPVNEISLAIREWKSTRESYPDWVILPEDRREVLWQNTNGNIYLLYSLDKVNAPDDLNFLFEFNWRMERCLCPIFNNLIGIYEKVIGRYNPFPNVLSIDNSVTPQDEECKTLPWTEIEEKWLELLSSLMRFYREEGFIDKWDSINEKFKVLYKFLSAELIAKLNYERCLCALFSLNIIEVKARIKEWPINSSLPLWEAKRAALLSEVGDIDTAVKLIEGSLSSIRKQLNLSPVSNNYLLVSQESYVMQLLQYVNNSIALRDGDFEGPNKNRHRFNERWNNLKQYKCDPWNEQNLFEIKLKQQPAPCLNNNPKNDFDIGRVTTSYNFNNVDDEALTAYSFLRYCEESATPFRIWNVFYSKKAVEGTLKRITNYSPFWAFATLIRQGDTDVVDTVFNRESIYKMDISRIDSLIDSYLSAMENAFSEITLGNKFKRDNFAVVLALVIPEILSRLCVKCSDNAKFKLLDFLNKLYLSENKRKFKGISNLTERLISSLSDKKQYELLPRLLKLPIINNEIIKREFPDPFYFISINNEFKSSFAEIKIDNSIVGELIEKIKSSNTERRIAIIRIEKLYRLNLLNKKQIEAFSDALWSQIDQKSHLPSNTDFYKFAFIDLPHPETISPGKLLKEFILKEPFPIQKLRQDKGISITGGGISLFHEIEEVTKKLFLKKSNVEWLEDELLIILNKLIEWWNCDKHYLKDDTPGIFISVSDEFHNRFRYLVSILSNIIVSVLSINTSEEVKENIRKLFKELDEYGIPCLQSKAACLQFIEDNKKSFYFDILDAITSKNHSRIVDASYAIIKLCEITNIPGILEVNGDDILYLLTQQIKWRRRDGLVSILNTMNMIISEYPQYLNEKLLSDVLIGLKYLCDESNPAYTEIDVDVLDRLSYRESAAHLAFTLFEYYSKKKESVPKTISDWRTICFDKNEFAEVRNQWIEV